MVGIKGQVQQRGVQRRRGIVRAAMELFAEHGYRGTSLATVAVRAGVPTSLITHHFGSKEGLLQAVLEEMDLQSLAELDDIVSPGWHAAAARMVQHAGQLAATPSLAALRITLTVENLAGSAALHPYFLRRSRLLRDLWARAIREGIEAGELSAQVDPDTTATEIAAFLEGAVLLWLQDPDTINLAATYHRYFTTLTTNLAPTNPPRS